MLFKIDDILNQITMYRLVLYGLSLLAVVVFTFSITGALDFEPVALAASFAIIIVAGFTTNQLLQHLLKIPSNFESAIITCLIVFFLFSPTTNAQDLLAASLVTLIAVASKFFITYRRKHLFNPAAFGFVVVGFIGMGHASWWVGSAILWPFTLVLGLLVARKIRRLSMVLLFWIVSLVTGAIIAVSSDVSVAEHVELLILSSPLIFLGSIMLTEPSTMPPKRLQQLLFAVMAAVLFAAHPGSGLLHVYPETALLVVNLYAFLASDKRRYVLKYVTRHQQGADSYDYVFEPDVPLRFTPGQYLEMTLPLKKLDDRGNRRTFTIASSPSEKSVHFGIRIPALPSRFKQELETLEAGQAVLAGQIAGSFTLPNDASRKLLLIAGGVGITPFRSMVQAMIDDGEKRDMLLIYVARSADDFMYEPIFSEAKKLGLKTIYVPGATHMTSGQLSKLAPAIKDSWVYISGPPAMTRHFRSLVNSLGVRRRHVKTDYFAGY